MFGRRKSGSRSARKAAKADRKARRKAEKLAEKAARKSAKAARRGAAGDSRAQRKADRAAKDAAKKAAKASPPRSFVDSVTDPKTVRRATAAAKVVGPVVAPFALKAATSARDFLDTRRAAKLGVSPEEVGAYRGPTGATEARMKGLAAAVHDLRTRRQGDLQVTRFADVASRRLGDLTVATRTAASMPGSRRRSTLHAVHRELDRIDADLMTFLVGR